MTMSVSFCHQRLLHSSSSTFKSCGGGGRSRSTIRSVPFVRWLSATPLGDGNKDICRRSFSVESSTDDYLTGTVKFYLRDRLFGFIIPDDPLLAKTNELWCHRTSIKSDRSFEESPSRPYLRNKERVKFRIQAPTEEERDTPVAIDIVFENGRQVPLFRKNYLDSLKRGEATRAGQALLDLFATQGDHALTDEETLQKVRDIVSDAQHAIDKAEKDVQEYRQSHPEDEP